MGHGALNIHYEGGNTNHLVASVVNNANEDEGEKEEIHLYDAD